MSFEEALYPIDVSQEDTSIDAMLRESTIQAFAQARSGGSTDFATTRLRQIERAFTLGKPDVALRQLDSVWRSVPAEDLPALAPLYGRVLAQARDCEATLGMLQRAKEFAPDADLAALTALTLLRLQRPVDAHDALKTALTQYCVNPGGLLSCVAGMVVRDPRISAAGWVGRGPRLELVGQLSPDEPSKVLEIRINGGPAFTQLLGDTDGSGLDRFEFPPDRFADASTLEVSSRGVPLLGSGCTLPEQFALDGSTATRGRCVVGWARIGWLPTQPPCTRVRDESGNQVTLSNARRPIGAHRWPFAHDLRASRIRGERLHVESQLPDGRWLPLPDSPLLLAPAVRLRNVGAVRLPKWKSTSKGKPICVSEARRARSVDLIIPVYRGREESLACIGSVLATVGVSNGQVVVVDDATDDSLLVDSLDTLAAAGRITLLRNSENFGFARSVNRGLALNPTHDAVILNSDTAVFGNWVTRLREAAYSGPRVGTATPLSNSGSIVSYPNPSGGSIQANTGKALDELARSLHVGKRVEIPVGVGFCLYVRRDCLRETGSFDAGVFGKGYGEETDFCLRARRRGWSHKLAADVFVYHTGGISFASRRVRLLERSQRLLNLRHPGYDMFIAGFLAGDPIRPLRRQLDEQRLLGLKVPFALLVTSALPGGVERFVTERSRHLQEQGLVVLLLRPAGPGNLRRCELWTDALDLPNLRYEIPTDFGALQSMLRSMHLEAVEIQHFLHLDPAVIETVRMLPVPYDVFVHDYAWICPRITLIDESGRYCGEPRVTVCQQCAKRNGTTLGEKISVPHLRERSSRWLREARRVIVPSTDTATRLRKHFSALTVEVRPHTAPIERIQPPKRVQRDIVRVGLIGAIGGHKGYRVLLDCARDARARRLPIEFVVIGYTEDDKPLLATGKVFVTGRYSESEVEHLIDRERPDIFWSPSVWPETWCYTLDHALRAGGPIVSFDLGAIAERLHSVSGVLRLPLTIAPARINDLFCRMGRGEADLARSATDGIQTLMSYAVVDTKVTGSESGETSVNKAADGQQAQAVQNGLSASIQVLPLPTGLYLFSVKAATPVVAPATGQLALPAVHVGLGPGVRAEEVEFVAGPETHGGWLFAKGDLLVAKVKGPAATLVLTSVRAPGGEVMSIKVERLEARADAAPAQAKGNGTQHDGISSDRGGAGKMQAARADRPSTVDDSTLPLAVGAHIRTRGDMSFSEVSWAGRIAPGLWIESFCVRPLERFGAEDIEYKGLTGSGFETPWLSDDKMCGTKGMSTPLLGFAIRLKPSPAAAAYDCEYSGYFASGLVVGPVRNGVPCRSSVASDPLEGIQARLVKRSAMLLPGAVVPNTPAKSVNKKKGKRAASPARSVSRSARSTRRTSSRRS